MAKEHVANAETGFVVVNIAPDMCEVEGKVVPFDIQQTLAPELGEYALSVFARGRRVIKVGSVTEGVIGNAGRGVLSSTSQRIGHVIALTGSSTVKVEGKPCVRHGDLAGMNACE